MIKDLAERKTVYLDDAIDALNEYFARIGKLKRGWLTIEERAIKLDAIDAIKALPPAQQERPTGEWIVSESEEVGALGIRCKTYTCPSCGWDNSLIIPRNFCPNCGVRTVQEGEDNDS